MGDPAVRPLPVEAHQLLETLDAPPRLAAHLRAVHDVACDLTAQLAERHPALAFDRAAVLFGAATHDVGKVVHVDELSGPGSAHEEAGYRLLRAHGFDESLARFARNHAAWSRPEITVEDLLVSLADKIWKAKRVPDLENLVVARLAVAESVETWQAFLSLDDILHRLAAGADQRLAYQGSHPVVATPTASTSH
jgi:HD superfamily phosphodiesterase